MMARGLKDQDICPICGQILEVFKRLILREKISAVILIVKLILWMVKSTMEKNRRNSKFLREF